MWGDADAVLNGRLRDALGDRGAPVDYRGAVTTDAALRARVLALLNDRGIRYEAAEARQVHQDGTMGYRARFTVPHPGADYGPGGTLTIAHSDTGTPEQVMLAGAMNALDIAEHRGYPYQPLVGGERN